MERKWWHDKVAYQIYPKSFCDTSGNGIGDIRGIIGKLDYLKDLGVDIIWLSPIYTSPLADQGYDIADYYNIDPRFGTMEDMDELLAESKKRNMYILMDLVVNHCSDEHEWFKKAMEDPDGKYGKYFYLEDRKEDGTLPCNWRSYFGGPVWDVLPGTDKLYLHSFHKKQPDLNWENPELREEVYKNINWWLEKGLAGFRIDAIINIKKALPFKNYESDRKDGLSNIQDMLNEATGISEFLLEMRDRTFNQYGAFTVGEVFDEKEEEIPDFIGDNGYFSSMFDFNETIFGMSENGWYDQTSITPDDYKQCCFGAQQRSGDVGFLSNIIENHDEPRGVSHYIPEGQVNDKSKKLLATVYFMVKGLPFIYQGQELGMENTKFSSINEIDDISTLDQYQVALDAGLTEPEALKAVTKYSRDHARTPMQWSNDTHAGFTNATPWLAVNPNYTSINAKAQAGNPDSVYEFYKKLIALRKNPTYKETIVYGNFEPYMEAQKNLISYFRKTKEQSLLVIANFQPEAQNIVLPGRVKEVLLNNYEDVSYNENEIAMKGHQAVIFVIE